VNVIVSAVLSSAGAPARVLRAWSEGEFELIVSPALLAELERTLSYPKISKLITAEKAAELIELISEAAMRVNDPEGEPPLRSADPEDDYLIALAAEARVPLVSGDRHLLDLAPTIPVLTVAEFAELLRRRP